MATPFGRIPPMTTTPDLFRAHAIAHGLSREELQADPFLQFQDWFEAAIAIVNQYLKV